MNTPLVKGVLHKFHLHDLPEISRENCKKMTTAEKPDAGGECYGILVACIPVSE